MSRHLGGIAVLFAMAVSTAVAQTSATTSQPTAAPGNCVRLVVLVVVDQMRADYLTRYAPLFGEGGFKRLMRDGAHFANAYFSHASSATGPGHATISTGSIPRFHGITGNEWYIDPVDVDFQKSVSDRDSRMSGCGDANEIGASPRSLLAPALGDQLKLADRRSRVFSTAIKARAAVMLGGRKPDGVYWFDDDHGCFQTSTYYRTDLPPALAAYNAERRAARFAGQTWDRLLKPEAYAGCYENDPAVVGKASGLGPTFPHRLPGSPDKADKKYCAALISSPFGDEVTFDVAECLMTSERLGQGPATDMLCINLSSFDIGGHIFGPESEEMLDFAVRTDRQIAAFLDVLDRQVGLAKCLVAVTADHGVSTIPPLAQQRGLGGGQIDFKKLWESLNAALVSAVGPPHNGRRYVTGIALPWVYFDRSFATLDAGTRAKLLDVATRVLRETPGVQDVYSAAELSGPPPSRDDEQRWLAWRAYCPGRAGELYMQLAPYWYKTGKDVAGHTVGFRHDRHVPILLMGPGVRPGRYFVPADPADIAPTLAALIGIEPPFAAVGRVLHEALDSSARP